MRKVILYGLLLCIGVATAFGQKSSVQVFGVPFGSTYDEFLTAFSEKGFTGKTYIYEGGSDVEVSGIYGTFICVIYNAKHRTITRAGLNKIVHLAAFLV